MENKLENYLPQLMAELERRRLKQELLKRRIENLAQGTKSMPRTFHRNGRNSVYIKYYWLQKISVHHLCLPSPPPLNLCTLGYS